MREVRRRPDGALIRFEFAASPPLPTYLVALAVGAFDMRDGLAGTLPDPPRSRRRARPASAAGALAAARGELVELERYFGRPYPYAKLDLLAVPSFGAGAMENAGLITFREERLLLDERAALAARVGMASIIAHELAHQWFGDLVTMAWWDDLWLNEAFATLMADEIVDAWRPATGARLQALAAKSQVMADDSLATARRIRQPVRSTSEALEAFDSVTYAKGRAVLAMIEAWLGPDAFRAGLRGYLQRHEWGNATADDLYAALGEASGGRDVAGVMRSFTDQTGVPIVDARDRLRAGKAPAVTPAPAGVPHAGSLRRTAPRSGAFPSASSSAGEPARRQLAQAVHGPDGAREATLELDGRAALSQRSSTRTRARPATTACASAPPELAALGAVHRPGCPSASASASSATPGRRCAPASFRCRRFSICCLRLEERPQPPGLDGDAGGAARDRSRAGHRRRCARRSRASCARCAGPRRGASAGARRRRSPTTSASCARRS